MALPILETPTYELELPSTGKIIKYRPFLVKEFKILLTALESEVSEITRILLDLIDNCTFNKLNVNKLAHFDIEFIFVNLRAKSIGELTDLNYKCDCEFTNNFSINLLEAKIIKPDDFTNRIMITNDVGVQMRYPKFNEIISIYENLKTEKVISLICDCIEKIFTKDETYNTEDQSKEEIIGFLESFSKKQFEKLENFFLNMPKLENRLNHICKNCSKENTIVLEGLQNFFV